MMAPCVQVIQLAVPSMRKPRQRMPIGCVERGKCPLDRRPGQTGPRVQVTQDIALIVEIDELVMEDRPKCAQGRAGQQCADQQRAAGVILAVHRGWAVWPQRILTATTTPPQKARNAPLAPTTAPA